LAQVALVSLKPYPLWISQRPLVAMAIQSKKRSALALRLTALVGVSACLLSLKPVAFTVKDTWDVAVSDLKTFPKGLHPASVDGLVISGNTSRGAALDLALKDKMQLRYTQGPLSARFDDKLAWQANYTADDIAVILSGVGTEPFSWEARKQAEVEGLGDVEVNVSSATGFGVSVARALPTMAGLELKGYARANNDALLGRLEAARSWGDSGTLQYTMENPQGDYELENLIYTAKLTDTVQEGTLKAMLKRAASTNSYNVSYEHGLNKLLNGDASMLVGLDNAGIYGKLQKSHPLPNDMQMDYAATGRSDTDFNNPTYTQTLRLSNDKMSVTLSQDDDDAPVAKAATSNVDVAGMSLSASLNTTLQKGAELKYNVTASRDISKALNKFADSGEIVIGADDTSADGVYGLVQASRELGNGFTGKVSVASRGKKVTPTMTVSNRLGYAQLRKDADSPARVRVGYQFSV